MSSQKNKAASQRPERSDAIAEIVLDESQYGTPPDEIADLVGLNAQTLLNVYAQEIRIGRSRAKSAIRKKIYDLCLAGNVPLLIFYAKAQMGWNDKGQEDGKLEEKARALSEAVRSALKSVGGG